MIRNDYATRVTDLVPSFTICRFGDGWVVTGRVCDWAGGRRMVTEHVAAPTRLEAERICNEWEADEIARFRANTGVGLTGATRRDVIERKVARSARGPQPSLI